MKGSLRQATTACRARLPMRFPAWESLCLRCGLCCYEKETAGGLVVTNYSRPCLYLDTTTHLCMVYDQRFTVCANCRPMTLWHAFFVSWLPASCGYVRHFRRKKVEK
jgi:uncharacterized protein